MAQALNRGVVPDRERLTCFMVWVIGPLAFGTAPHDSMPEGLNAMNVVLGTVLSVAGFLWCFRSCPPDRRHAFVDHCICLSIPVAFSVVLPLYCLPGFVVLLALPDNPLAWKIIVPLGWLVTPVFFWRLRHFLLESMGHEITKA